MRHRPAFTLIEVTLVIALSSIIFIAFITSVSSSISRKRYSDSVQNFAEFLRNQYSATINVQNNGTGNTNRAIYGRLVTFGEGGGTTVYAYDIVGDASSASANGANIKDALQNVNATVFSENGTGTSCRLLPVNETSYNLTYGAWLETTASRNGSGSGTKFTGSLIIARSPVSGTVYTLFSRQIIQVRQYTNRYCSNATASKLLANNLSSFSAQQIDFCIASDDQPSANTRRDVRIATDGKNTSAVQILSQEEVSNPCNG